MKGYLLDTNILVWALSDDARLGHEARRVVAQQRDLHVSAATMWEIAIKRALGKLRLSEDPLGVARKAGCAELPITWAHADAVTRLPMLHRDPFDRLLVAQALLEDLTLVTSDAMLTKYPVRTLF